MKAGAVLQRGKGPLSAPADGALFHLGRPPERVDSASGPLYSIDWDGEEPVVLLTEAGQTLAVEIIKQSFSLYSFSHEQFGSIQLVKDSWFSSSFVPPALSGLVLSYQGWSHGRWWDGVWGRFEDARFTDLIMPGKAFRIQLGEGAAGLETAAWIEEHRLFSLKQSLIEALRVRYADGLPLVLTTVRRGAEAIWNMLLLRLAFPKARFALFPHDEAWKRLAQNLAVVPLRQAESSLPTHSLDDDWGSPETIKELLQWQIKQSPFVPARLSACLES